MADSGSGTGRGQAAASAGASIAMAVDFFQSVQPLRGLHEVCAWNLIIERQALFWLVEGLRPQDVEFRFCSGSGRIWDVELEMSSFGLVPWLCRSSASFQLSGWWLSDCPRSPDNDEVPKLGLVNAELFCHEDFRI